MKKTFAILVILAAALTLPSAAWSQRPSQSGRMYVGDKSTPFAYHVGDGGPVAPASFAVPDGGGGTDCCSRGCADGSCQAAPSHCWNLWGSVEYTLSFTSGRNLPPLVTTGGAPVGVLPGATILFGNSEIGTDSRSGGRVDVGVWLSGAQTFGIGGKWFGLEGATTPFDIASPGTPGSGTVAIPFIDPNIGFLPNAVVLADPAGLPPRQGGVSIRANNDVNVAEAYTRTLLESGNGYRFDLLLGYQFSRIDDDLSIVANTAPLLGATTTFRDSFDCENEFHGGEFGLHGTICKGPWSVNLLGKLGIGQQQQRVTIRGTQTPAVLPDPGGIFARNGRNTGVFERDRICYLPEAGVTLNYALLEGLNVSIGYQFLYWSSVVLAGDQIDTTVNFLNGAPNRPAFAFRDTDMWIQSLTLGLSFAY